MLGNTPSVHRIYCNHFVYFLNQDHDVDLSSSRYHINMIRKIQAKQTNLFLLLLVLSEAFIKNFLFEAIMCGFRETPRKINIDICV